MKKLIFMFAMLIGLAGTNFAQTPRQDANAIEKARGLKRELNLTPAQTSKITAIYQESAQKFDRIKAQEHGDTNKMLVAIRPLRAQTISRIKQVLTRRQIIKYDRLLDQRGSESGGGWGDGWTAAN